MLDYIHYVPEFLLSGSTFIHVEVCQKLSEN